MMVYEDLIGTYAAKTEEVYQTMDGLIGDLGER